MEKDCVASFYIKLTANSASLPLDEMNLIMLVRSFRYFSRKRAIETLFTFRYGTEADRKNCLDFFRKNSDSSNIDCSLDEQFNQIIKFTEEQFLDLANELEFQYKAKDPMFLDISSIRGLPRNSCVQELTDLKSSLGDSNLLFFITTKKCVNARKHPLATRWIVQLLSSNIADQCVALENLGFSFNYRLQVKSATKQIGNLLLTLVSSYVKRQKLLTSSNALSLPVVFLLRNIVHLDKQILFILGEEVPPKNFYAHSEKVDSFDDEVGKFVEILEAQKGNSITLDSPVFIDYQKKLQRIGNSLTELLRAHLKYCEIYSKQENNAILYVAVTKPTVFMEMQDVQKKYKNAEEEYSLALEDFKQFYSLNF